MNEKQDSTASETGRAETPEVGSAGGGRDAADIGTGKRTGLYGCALLLLGVLIVFIVLILTGIYNPFQGTEGVGP
jgi:hypothetical protein